MKILLPLFISVFIFFGVQTPQVYAQCATPTVSFPAGKDIAKYCGPSTVAFSTTSTDHKPTYTVNGGSIKSYSWEVNGVVTSQDPNPTINFPTAGSYTVAVTATSTCGKTSEPATQTIIVEALPDPPLVEDVYACSGSKATLWVQDARTELIYKWYSTPIGGTPLVWGTSYTTAPLNQDVTLYVEAVTQSGCVSATRTEAKAIASSIVGGAQSIGSNQEICSGVVPAMLTGAAPSAGSITYQWYQSITSANTGFTPIATGRDKDYNSPALYTTTWFKRVAYRDGCAVESNVVKITVTTPPATPTAIDTYVCSGQQATLTVSNPDPTVVYRWYATPTSTTTIGSGISFRTPVLTADRSYYVEASTTSATNCFNPTRVEVKVFVTPPIINYSITANQAICSGGTPSKLIGSIPSGGGNGTTGDGYVYQWQQSTDGTFFKDIIGANAIDYSPPALSTTTWYRRKVRTSGPCPEVISNAVKISVTPLPVSLDIVDPTVCIGSPATIVISNPEPGFTYRWYDVSSGDPILATGASYTTVPLTSDKTYYVDAITADGCITTRRPVNVKVTALPAKPAADGVTVCQGSSATLTVKSADDRLFYRWYNQSMTLLASGTTYTTQPLTANATYFVEAVTKAAPGCESELTTVEVIISAPITNNIISGEQEICSGGILNKITGTIPAGNGGGFTYQWEKSEDGAFYSSIANATAKDYTPGTLTTTTWFRRRVKGIGPCPEHTSNAVKITVNPLPSTPSVNNVSICANTSATLKVNSPEANVTFRWYAVATGGSPLATGNTYTTDVLTTNRTYYVEGSSAAGCVSPTRQSVTVTVSSIPNTPQADNAATCAGGAVTLSVANPDGNMNYKWYNAATGGTLLATGSNYTTSVLSTSTTFYVEAETAAGCTSPSRKAVYVDVTPLPATPEANGTTICAGDKATVFVNNPDPSLIYRWYDGSNLLGTGISFTTDILSYSTTYYVEAINNAAANEMVCASPTRKSVTVTVIPTIANNSISANQTICGGGTPAKLTGTTPNGGGGNYTYQWEYSEDGTNFTKVTGATNQDFSPGALTLTTWFRRKVQGQSSCPVHVSNTVKVTISPVPATPSAANVTVCAGEAATLSVTSPDASLTYKWYTTATGGTALASGNSYTAGSLTASTTYYVDATTASGCVSSRRAVTAAVRPQPSAPTVADKAVCEGDRATLSVSFPDPTLTYKWFSINGTLLATGTTYTTDYLTASITYYVEASTVTAPVCTSSRKTVVVTVNPKPTAPFVPSVTICAGTSAVLTVQSADADLTYKWYTAPSGGTPIATGSSYTTTTLTSASTYYIEAYSGSGCVSPRSEALVNVTSSPDTPFADDLAVCAGSPAELTVKDVDPTLTYRWYNTATGGILLATGTTYTVNTPSTTTYYVEAVTAQGCASASRDAATVTVTTVPGTPDADNANICSGSTTTLRVNNPATNLIYRWYSTNGTLLSTGIAYTTTALTINTTYYIEAATGTTPTCVSNRKAVTVNVTPLPATPVADNVTVCAGTAATLKIKVVEPDMNYSWYTVATGGTPVATGTSFTTGSLTTNRTYYAEATSTNGCASSSRKAVTVTVTPQPEQPAAPDHTICYGDRATLTVSSPDAAFVYNWYDKNGAPLATGITFTTEAQYASNTFYVEAATKTSPACTSPRKAVNVNVTPLPAVPLVDDVMICSGATATLLVKNAGPSAVYKWYDDNGILLATNTTYTTASLTNDAIYYVEAATGSGCVNPVRATVTVYVTQPITNNTITAAQTICIGDTPAKLTGTQPVNNSSDVSFQWERSEDGINFTSINNATGRDFAPGSLNVTTWFRRTAKVVNSICPPHVSNSVKVTIVPLPATPVADNITICSGATAKVSVSAPEIGFTYRWYDVETGGNILAAGETFTVEGLKAEKTYYVEAVNQNNCVSSRRSVTVFVTPLPAMPQAEDKVICTGDFTTLSVTNLDVKLNYRWFDAKGSLVANGSSFTTPALTSNTLYFVEAYTNTSLACTSQRKAVNVSVLQLPATPEADDKEICAGSATTLSIKQPDPSLAYRWYTAATGGVAIAASPSLETGALTSDKTYYVEAITTTGCVSLRKAIKVTVAPLPDEPLADNQAVCSGQPVVLSVKQPDATLTYRWFDTAGKLLATGNTYSISGLQTSTSFYVEAMTAVGCTSPTRKAVVVSVTSLPATPSVENGAICSGEKATLYVKNPDPSLEYRWYNDAAGTNPVGSGISFTSPTALYSNRSYFVEAVNTAGCVSPAREQADVLVTNRPSQPAVNDALVCAGSSATLAVTAPDASVVYKWFHANGTLLHTGTTYTTVPLSSQSTYTVVAFAATASGCTSTSEGVTVSIVTPITSNSISNGQTICSNTTPATLNGSLPAGGGTTGLEYQWERSSDGLNFASIVGAHGQDYTPNALTSDTWFRRKVKAAGPCAESISNTVKVTVVPLPATPVAEGETVCAGNSATLRVNNPSSTADNITYHWYNVVSGGNSLASGISFTTPILTASTTYYVEAVNGNGCISSSRRAVQVLVDQPISNNSISSPQRVCSGATPAAFTGTVPAGGNGTYTYQWQYSTDGATFTDIPGATGQGYTSADKFVVTTWFRRKVIAGGPCAESISNTVKVEVVQLPVAPTVNSAAICPGNSVTLSVSAMAGLTVEWYDAPQGGNLIFIGSTFRTPVISSTTSYWVQTVNANRCVSATRQEVKVNAVGPQVAITDNITITEGKMVQLNATGGVAYSWSPAEELSDASIANPVATPTKTTTYYVAITTKEGCTVTKGVTITVLPKVEITNVITPNGDGFNDKFLIRNIENYPNCIVEIYTRWGEKIFESKGYSEPWDGRKNGTPLPMSAYYYIIRLDKDSAPISGSVTIVK
ncbi:gliding motility-associated C-terminal domain-containing protein [Pontibacter locisalis]|uniref:Gliding motility-associated C-terminal domain-containing protein n=1 Tax=Pontibacter locisalis TaxID=1719035 RepID=A0ABW5ILI8_9BACT